MVKGRVAERRQLEAIERGQDNARLIPRVQRWCRNINVRVEAVSLLGQLNGLPIGPISVTCEFASSSRMQFADLRRTAASFIAENCVGCPHRVPVSLDNFGAEVLAAIEAEEREAASPRPAPTPARDEVRRTYADSIPSVIKSRPTTERSVLEYIAALEGQDSRKRLRTGETLVAAARIGPELFSDLALRALAEHFASGELGALAVRAVRTVLSATPDHPLAGELIEAGRVAMELNFWAEDDISLLLAERVESDPGAAGIEASLIVEHLRYRRAPDTGELPEVRDGKIRALEKLGRVDLQSVADALIRRLREPDPMRRVDASRAIEVLIRRLPKLGTLTAAALIESLELDDTDDGNDSADTAATEALAAIYERSPESTRQVLEAAADRASGEVAVLLLAVYGQVLSRLNDRWRLAEDRGSAESRIYLDLIKLLLSKITTLGLPFDLKVDAAEMLADAVGWPTGEDAALMETTLGAMAILAAETPEPPGRGPSDDPARAAMNPLQYQADVGAYFKALDDLARSATALAWADPGRSIEVLAQVIDNLDSRINAPLKAKLVSIYGSLGAGRELLPLVLPHLFRHMMDFESHLVRGEAVGAVEAILGERRGEIPENVIDSLATLILDPTDYVRRKAVSAIERVGPVSEGSAWEICDYLSRILPSYRGDRDFVQRIVMTGLWIAWRFPDLAVAVIERMAEPVIAQAPTRQAEWLLWRWMTMLDVVPETRGRYVQRVLEHLSADPLAWTGERGTNRFELFRSLVGLPVQAVEPHRDLLVATARAHLARDPRSALRFVEVLSQLEMHAAAASLADEIAGSVSGAGASGVVAKDARRLAELERAEVDVIAGNVNGARERLAALIESAADDEDDEERGIDPLAAIRALTRAERVARRTRRL